MDPRTSRDVLLDEIPFQLSIGELLDRLHIEDDTADADRVREMVAEAEDIGRPRGLYRVAFIDSKGEDFVVADGARFDSRVLRVNLEDVQRIFPYVATCGTELEDWSNGIRDPLERFWADAIKQAALQQAMAAIVADMKTRHKPGSMSAMAPGSLADWPIQQQRALFTLLGDTERLVGVRLTDTFLMLPTKSISGIRFQTEMRFESCQLCPREKCPGRRAPYDPHLYESRYAS